MRYTTVIDITDYPDVYRNENVRLVYLHMVLKSGYHDDDRDQIRISIRSLAADLGMTVSAVRHALHVLQSHQLLLNQGGVWYVKKWVLDIKPTPRKQPSTASGEGSISDTIRRQEIEEQERVRRCDAWFATATREQLSEALEQLEKKRRYNVGGAYILPQPKAIEAIRRKLTSL